MKYLLRDADNGEFIILVEAQSKDQAREIATSFLNKEYSDSEELESHIKYATNTLGIGFDVTPAVMKNYQEELTDNQFNWIYWSRNRKFELINISGLEIISEVQQ